MKALFSPSRSPLLLVFKNNQLRGTHDLPSPASPSQPLIGSSLGCGCDLPCSFSQSSPTLQTQSRSSGPRPLPLDADATYMNLSILSQTAMPPAPRLSQCGSVIFSRSKFRVLLDLLFLTSTQVLAHCFFALFYYSSRVLNAYLWSQTL